MDQSCTISDRNTRITKTPAADSIAPRSKRRETALAGLLQKNRIGLLAILLVVSLFNLCIHLSILRMRLISGVNTVLSIDEISTVFEPSAKPASPYPTAHRRFRKPVTRCVFLDSQGRGHLAIHVYTERMTAIVISFMSRLLGISRCFRLTLPQCGTILYLTICSFTGKTTRQFSRNARFSCHHTQRRGHNFHKDGGNSR